MASAKATALTLTTGLITALMTALMLAACGGGGGDDDFVGPTDEGQDGRIAQMRFINSIPDSPTIEMLHEGTGSARFTEFLPFGQGSNRNDFVIGDFFFNFGFVNGSGTRTTFFETSDLPLIDGVERNFIMIGPLNDASLLLLENPEFLVGLDDATADVPPQIQFLHTAVGVGSIDFYLTDEGADIASASPLATLAFGENSEIFDTTANETAQLRAFVAGSTTELLFDSGATTFVRTTRALVMAINYFGPVAEGDSAVELRRFSRVPVALGNANQPSTLRVHNVVSDQDGIDLFLGDDVSGTPDIANVEFTERSAELQIDAQTTAITVTSQGNPLDVLLELPSVQLSGGNRTTLYVGGEASDPDDNNAPNIATEAAVESDRRIADGVPIRIFNGSTINDTLQVFLLRPGEDLSNTTPNSLVMGGYVAIPVIAGAFDIVIVETGNNSTIFGPERVVPTPNTALNIAIRDTSGGTTPVQVDFVEDETQGL